MQVIYRESEKQKLCNKTLLSGKYFFVLYGGAIRGGKTYNIVFLFITLALLYPKSRWTIVRRHMSVLRDTVIEMMLGLDILKKVAKWNGQTRAFYFSNGSMIKLFATNTEAKGGNTTHLNIETNGIAFDEMDVQEHEFDHLMSRVGSWKQGERGTNPVTGAVGFPPNFAVGTSNPQRGWVKRRFYDKFRDGLLEANYAYIQAKIDDNIGIEDKEVYKAQLRASLSKREYEEKVEGDWDYVSKNENAFFYSFDYDYHIKKTEIREDLPMLISFDNNVYPYISVSFWQIDNDNKEIKQVHEMPCKNPKNTALKAAEAVSDWLASIGWTNGVVICGDSSAKSSNTIDVNKQSFADLFLKNISKGGFHVLNRIGTHNPSVAATGDFCNALYENWGGWQIFIDEKCKESIIDYSVVQRANDGTMEKKKGKNESGLSFELNGHFSDAKRYLIYSQLYEEFKLWQRRFDDTRGVAIDSEIYATFANNY